MAFKNFIAILFLSSLLGACAHWPAPLKSDTGQLKERAASRWQALINKDWESAYAFELPAYRKTHDLQQYRGRFGSSVQWKTIEFISVEMVKEAVLADVNLKLRYRFAMPGAELIDSDKALKERWMKQEGEWWIVSSQ